MKKLFILVALTSFILVSCAKIQLTPGGNNVTVIKDQPQGCKELETLTTPLGDPNLLKIWLRNQTAEKGGDTVMLESTSTNNTGLYQYIAVAYKCKK
jgi:hypothetical protein